MKRDISQEMVDKILAEKDPSFVVHASRTLNSGSTAEIASLIRLEPIEGTTVMPLRGVSYGVDTARAILQGRLNPDLPMYTLRHKGQTTIMTLADLRLVLKDE